MAVKKVLISHFFIINLIFSYQIDQEFISYLKKTKESNWFYSDYLEKLEDLILKGANVNVDVEGTTPLVIILDKYFAAKLFNSNELKILKMLIKHGANVNVGYHRNRTMFNIKTSALMAFDEYDYERIFELMLKNGADPNFTGDSPLSPLMVCNHHHVITLLQYGANANRKYYIEGYNYNALQWRLSHPIYHYSLIMPLLHATDSLTREEKLDLITTVIEKDKNSWSSDYKMQFELYQIFVNYVKNCDNYKKFKKQFLNKISEQLSTIDSNTLKLINSYCEISQIDWYLLNYKSQ